MTEVLSILAGVVLAAAAGSFPDHPITLYGIGPIRVGSSVRDASVAAGEEFVEATDKPSGTEGCYHVRLKSVPSILFMVESERLVRVETADPRFRTKSGARVGDSEARVREIYGSRLKVTGHKYVEAGHYFIVLSADGHHGLVLETDGKQVVYIRAGLEPAAEYVEGCQ